MKALFVPYYPKVPYQHELAAALRKQGVEVAFGTGYKPFCVILLSVIKGGLPDVLHIHWLTFFYASAVYPIAIIPELFNLIFEAITLFVLRLIGVEIVWTVHNRLTHDSKFKKIELFVCRLMARISGAIIVHSNEARDMVMNEYGVRDSGKVNVIFQGNYIAYYPNTITKKTAREKLGIAGDKKVFLYFGLIKPYKALSALINAFRENDLSGHILLVAGKPLNKKIEREVVSLCDGRDNIKTFLKFIPDDEAQIYVNASDAVVMSYGNVLTSAALLFAMSFGKAVLAPDFRYFREMAMEEGCVYYEKTEPEAIKNAVKKAVSMDLDFMGAYNLVLAKKYSWDISAELTKGIYMNLTRGNE
ncbi:MAG TPA: glycosyltransferase [Candidatus Omnitrophota bacterium]|nr:glycosyltransferase [Candidatus Omnitrophota bacterium]